MPKPSSRYQTDIVDELRHLLAGSQVHITSVSTEVSYPGPMTISLELIAYPGQGGGDDILGILGGRGKPELLAALVTLLKENDGAVVLRKQDLKPLRGDEITMQHDKDEKGEFTVVALAEEAK